MSPTAIKAISWIAAVLLLLAIILALGFGGGIWPFTQMPPGSLHQ